MTTQDQTCTPRDWRGTKGRDERAPFWYVVSVQRQHEIRIETILLEMGFKVRLPCRIEYRDWNGATKARRRAGRKPKEERRFPLFAGMMLIGFPSDPPPWKDLFDKGLITSTLALNGTPRRLRKREVAQFRISTWSTKFRAPEKQRHMNTHGEFDVGEWVRPDGDSWGDVSFQVLDIDGGKAKIWVNLLKRPQLVEYPVDELVRVE